MPIKKYKPMTPGRRGMTTLAKDEITTSKPEKSLLAPLKSKGGRNNTGRITTRHQGSGHKRTYRIIDFKRNNCSTFWKLFLVSIVFHRIMNTHTKETIHSENHNPATNLQNIRL